MTMDTFGEGTGYLKAGFLGFNKSGKTFTAMLLALHLRKFLGLGGPIAVFDTEASVEYIAPRIKAETGLPPIGKKSRALVDLLEVGQECEAGASSILIVDSITHVWREVCAAYLDQVNRALDSRNKPRRNRLEFQDWSAIKDRWALWTDFYLNSKLHIIICGRAGYEWDFQETEEANGQIRKELVKTGVKMKVESEFGFEPSLLVQMERVQIMEAGKHKATMHRATILGDRFDAMDGDTQDDPAGEWFAPHLKLLAPGIANVVDTALKTDMGVDESGQSQYDRNRREWNKVLEEVEGEIVKAFPGQSAAEKRQKVVILEDCFGTKSWSAVKDRSVEELKRGLAAVREWITKHAAPAAGKDAE
jgi:hypothetical protein